MFYNIFKKETSSDKVISIKVQEEQLKEFDRLVDLDSTNRNRVIKELMQLYIDKKVKFNFLDIEEKDNYYFNNNLNNLIIGNIGKGKNLIFKNIINDLIYDKKIIYLGNSEKEIGLLAFSELYNKKIYNYNIDGINCDIDDLIYLINKLEHKNDMDAFFHFKFTTLFNDLIVLLNKLSIEINIVNLKFYLKQENIVNLYNQHKDIYGFDSLVFQNIFEQCFIDSKDLSFNYDYFETLKSSSMIVINEIFSIINLKKGNKNFIEILEEYDIIILNNNDSLISLLQNTLEKDSIQNISLNQYFDKYSNLHIICDNINVSKNIILFLRYARKYVINWSIYLQESNFELLNINDYGYNIFNIILLQSNQKSIEELKYFYKLLNFDNLNVLLDNLKLNEYYLFNPFNKSIYKYKNKIN